MVVRTRTIVKGSSLARVAQGITVLALALCFGIILLGIGSAPDKTTNNDELTPTTPTTTSTPPPAQAVLTLGPEAETYVRQIVLNALRDPVGLRDFALQATGAKVLPYLTSSTLPDKRSYTGETPRAGPEAALRDDLRMGECWRIAGSSAQLGIGIPEFIHATHVTVDHIPIELASDIGEAPRKMFLWGVIDGPSNHALYRNRTEHGLVLHPPGLGRAGPPLSGKHLYALLATFQYNTNASFHIQTFQTDVSVAMKFYFGMFVLEIVDNWGGASTCLYRLRIHGVKALP